MITTESIMAKKDKQTEGQLPEGTRLIKDDLVTIEGTGSGKFLRAGKRKKVHRMHALTLQARGTAKIVD